MGFMKLSYYFFKVVYFLKNIMVAVHRVIGSKFEMVWPYYSMKRVHDVLGHAPPPLPPPGTPPLENVNKLFCSQIYFLGSFGSVVAEF